MLSFDEKTMAMLQQGVLVQDVLCRRESSETIEQIKKKQLASSNQMPWLKYVSPLIRDLVSQCFGYQIRRLDINLFMGL